MDGNSYLESLKDVAPEILLLISGLVAVLIVACYVKDKDSKKYKFAVAIGFILGLLLAFVAVGMYGEWRLVTSVFVLLAAFTLIIRPIRDVNFAVILGLLVVGLVYMGLANLEGQVVMGMDMSVIASGWPRIIVAFVVGAIAYMIANFAEAIVKMFGKLFNLWPILLIFGLICIAESMFMFMGYGSIIDYIDTESIKESIPKLFM